ncbi:MFS transporter [Actinomadura atramentaria]|uniref:MFS transporter n=1 Tax=Actinomadura atramentaria TaxID=1990 RepID=UPI000373D110|nr:MFS transporter [Actinomadura atramentaria]
MRFLRFPRGRSALVLGVVLTSSLAYPLTITGASVALPGLRAGLSAGPDAAQWAVNAYNVCFAGFLAFAGSLADAVGRRRVLTSGVTLFLAGTIACLTARDIAVFDAARAATGAGAAAATAAGASLLAATFDGPARARAFGLLGTSLGIGLAFGPTLSGLLVDAAGWRAVFALPAALTGAVLPFCALLPDPAPRTGRPDVRGGALFTAALLLLIAVVVQARDLPAWAIALGLLGAATLTAAFAATERGLTRRGTTTPLMDTTLFRDRRFTAYAAAAGTLMGVLVPILVYLPSYLVTVVGLDAGRAGLWTLMLTVPSVVLPGVGAALARRSPMGLVAGAVALTGTGALALTTITPNATALSLLIPMLLTGAGAGLTTGVVDGLAVSALPADRAGTAAGLFNTARLTVETIALAAAGAVLATTPTGHPTTHGIRIVCTTLGLTALLTAAALPYAARPRKALG